MTTTLNSKKRKRKKRQFYQSNNAVQHPATSSSSTTVPGAATSKVPRKEEDTHFSTHPRKRKRKNNYDNKKTSVEGSKEGIKPVLIVKKPEDFSANWKMLKEIITKNNRKPYPEKKPSTKGGNNNKNKNNTGKKSQKTICEASSDTRENCQKEEEEEAEGETSEKLDVWFDNVDPILLEETHRKKKEKPVNLKKGVKKPVGQTLVKEDSSDSITKVVAMDCEMVGVGMNGKDSILARVSIVNHFGKVLYDQYVKPTEKVVDYRTAVSGIRPADIRNGVAFSVVQKEVAELLKGRILVGHSVHNDLRTLFISHSSSHIRDTSKYKVFKRLFGGRTPSLKKLVERLLGVQIQQGEHSSVQDAQAAMRLYTMHRKEWEKARRNKYKVNALRSNTASAKREQKQMTQAGTEDESL